MTEWGNKIKSRIVALGMKQKDFAKKCGYEATWFSHILTDSKISDRAKQKVEIELYKMERKNR